MDISYLVACAVLYGLAGFGWFAACCDRESDHVPALVYGTFWPITAVIAVAWCLAMAGLRTWERLMAGQGRS